MTLKKLVLLTIVILFARNVTTAQTHKAKIKGTIFINENKPAVAATIMLMRISDSAMIQTTVGDSAGKFVFENMQSDTYRILISLIGFENYKSDTISFSKESNVPVNLRSITLVESVKKLADVTVIGKKPFIEHRLDKTVVNVNALISSTGLNAFEMLEKSPGVIISQNGVISYMGKTGVLILVDGKPTYLSGDNLVSYLKSLPASNLEQIELMSNPPARYEAGGTAGVINIRTKRSKTNGFTGTVASSIGITNRWRNNHSFNFNYLSGKVALFVNAGYGFQKSKRSLGIERSYNDVNHELVSTNKQQGYFIPANHSANIKIGFDYFISSKTTIGIALTGSTSPGVYYNPVSTLIFKGRDILDSSIVANNTANSRFNNGGINLNCLKRIDNAGGTFGVDLDYISYKARNNQTFKNNIYDGNENFKVTEMTSTTLPASINIYAAKTDYVKSLPNKIRFEAGAKTSYVNTDNAANYFKLLNNVSVPDYDNTNHFLYKENINASYINFNKELKRLSFQAGLRIENTNVEGLQTGNIIKPDSSFRQHYTNVFPTGYMQIKLDSSGRHLLNFSYGRRIDRPYYKDLNPFVYIVDKYTNFSGNPFLKPQLSSNYDMSYGYKSIFWVTLLYNRYKDFQTETVKQLNNIFISTTSNIGTKITKGINATVNVKPMKGWDVNFYTEVVNFKFRGQINNSRLNTNSTYFYFESGNQFAIGDGWSAEVSGFYISSRIVSQFQLDPKGQLSVGLQKKVLKDKGSLRLSASDIFKTNISSGNVLNIPGVSSSYNNYFDSRMLMLGFSYNFGKGNTSKKRNTGSSQSEQGRIKN